MSEMKSKKVIQENKKHENSNQNEEQCRVQPEVSSHSKILQNKGKDKSGNVEKDFVKKKTVSRSSVDHLAKAAKPAEVNSDFHSSERNINRGKTTVKTQVKSLLSPKKKNQPHTQARMEKNVSSSRIKRNKTQIDKNASTKAVTKKLPDQVVQTTSGSQKTKQRKNSSEKKAAQGIKHLEKDFLIRPTTSTIRKHLASENQHSFKEINKKQNSINAGIEGTDLAVEQTEDPESYEEDFEDYESDFEESVVEQESESSEGSDSKGAFDEGTDYEEKDISQEEILHKVSGLILHPTIVKRQAAIPPNVVEKKVRTEYLRMSTRSSTFLVKESSNSSPVKQSLQLHHKVINFSAAFEEQKKEKLFENIKKRGKDLLDLLTLDEISYEIFEMPSMPYDIFMKLFGHANLKQVLVQTEFCEDDETQTDEIDSVEKWTQNPAYDHLGFGGDIGVADLDMDESLQSHFKIEAIKLNRFLQNVTPVILNILNQTLPHVDNCVYQEVPVDMAFSRGCYVLKPMPFCMDSPVTYVCYSPPPATYFLAIHGNVQKLPISTAFSLDKGVISLWDTFEKNKPQVILISNSQPTCACFGPSGYDTVIAGMVDGSIMLWDLKESSHIHHMYDGEVSLRSPTYNTAAILNESHHSCVVAIQAFDYSKSQPVTHETIIEDGGKSYHIFSLDEMGILNVWVIVEIPKPDRSDTDLALAPEGKVKLTWTSSISLLNVNLTNQLEYFDLRTFDFRLYPANGNHVIVATDVGMVYHLMRNGQIPNPKCFSRTSGGKCEIRCINFSRHLEKMFVVGCGDGSAMIFNINKAFPLLTISQVAGGEPVIYIEWSQNCPAVFFVLDSSSGIHIWNIIESDQKPKFSYSSRNSRILWFTLFHFQRRGVKTNNDVPSQLVLAKENGEIEVHGLHNSVDFVSSEKYEEQLLYMQSL